MAILSVFFPIFDHSVLVVHSMIHGMGAVIVITMVAVMVAKLFSTKVVANFPGMVVVMDLL